jgi:hypothetical protein
MKLPYFNGFTDDAEKSKEVKSEAAHNQIRCANRTSDRESVFDEDEFK